MYFWTENHGKYGSIMMFINFKYLQMIRFRGNSPGTYTAL